MIGWSWILRVFVLFEMSECLKIFVWLKFELKMNCDILIVYKLEMCSDFDGHLGYCFFLLVAASVMKKKLSNFDLQ